MISTSRESQLTWASALRVGKHLESFATLSLLEVHLKCVSMCTQTYVMHTHWCEHTRVACTCDMHIKIRVVHECMSNTPRVCVCVCIGTYASTHAVCKFTGTCHLWIPVNPHVYYCMCAHTCMCYVSTLHKCKSMCIHTYRHTFPQAKHDRLLLQLLPGSGAVFHLKKGA
jgi:hypothetical protein